MTLANVPIYMTDEKDKKTLMANKKDARNTVKKAINLYEQGHLSEDMLKAIAELALASEIIEGIEIKIEKKGKKLLK